MKAVVYGAGVIGRGYIGAILQMSGYSVTFVELNEDVVRLVNEKGEYEVRFLMPDGDERHRIDGVAAVCAKDVEAVAELIAQADIMATAVGAKALAYIVSNILKGIRLRASRGMGPLDIILCENQMDVNRVFEGLMAEAAGADWPALKGAVGIVEASIGTTVPVQTAALLDGEPLRLSMERHVPLLVDDEGFLGDPKVKNMVRLKPFGFYLRRKLFIHNMGHAVCAYLGMLSGYTYIHEAIRDPQIRIVCQSAMTEAAMALSKAYQKDIAALYHYALDLMLRFENERIQVTCERVGSDIPRKLDPTDRLVGAAAFCREQGVDASAIDIAAAAALYQYLITENADFANAEAVFAELAGENAAHDQFPLIQPLLQKMRAGEGIRALREAAERGRIARSGPIV